MTISKIKKNNYFLSGALESASIFYDRPTVGSAQSVREDAIILNHNGLCRFYIGKKGITKAKNSLIKKDSKILEKEFIAWKQKWIRWDEELYILATSEKDWKKNWRRLDEISEDFWFDSYKVESLDSFADELEAFLSASMKKAKLDPQFLHSLITPTAPTVPEQIMIERHKISKKEYVRKYWFILAHWNGGRIFEPADMGLIEKFIKNLEEVKKFHEKARRELDRKTWNFARTLQILTLWREERKSFLQRVNLGYARVLELGSKALHADKSILAWTRIGEIDQMLIHPKLYEERKTKSVYYLPKGKKTALFLTGHDAENLFRAFLDEGALELKGTIASKGRVRGIVRLILKEHQFSRFEEGEILVTTMTRPEYVPLMKKARAIVTDEGGLTSHAAIISRELKIPCIIGTKNATQILHNGDQIEVDGEKGIVKIVT